MKTCPEMEALAGYADGSVSGPARERLDAHLAGCGKCRGEALALVRALEPAPASAPPGLGSRIVHRISRLKEGRRMSLRLHLSAAAAVLGFAFVGLVLLLHPRGDLPGRHPVVHAPGEKVPEDLGGSSRALLHLSTDKPVYRPGEAVFARGVLLDAFTREPLSSASGVTFEVHSARGALVAQSASVCQDGVGAFGWDIPRELPGGTYTLIARCPVEGYPPSQVSFDIRSYRVPRLRTDLQFLKKAYGPAEDVDATLSATRAEGGIPVAARVIAVATVDGAEVHRELVTLDAGGRAHVRFRLPGSISVGNGTLSMTVEDGGVQETAAKTIPIVVSRVALAFYPEGGDLVGGIPSRLYFEARTPRQDPADVSGRILDGRGREVARFESLHEGRGKVAFTPELHARYHAVIDRPSGVTETFPLPEIQSLGFSLEAALDRVPAGSPVRVSVASPVATLASIGLYEREKELAHGILKLEAGIPQEVSLSPPKEAGGVLRVTIFDQEGRPRAERLVFRAPSRSLQVEIKADSRRTTPSGKVAVTVRTTDRSGMPIAAVVGLSAVDDAVLETIDARDRAPRLPVQALLGADVRELKDPLAYLSGDPLSALRTDLLLGTQGWRRFGFVHSDPFVAKYADDARRVLALRQPPPAPMEEEFADAEVKVLGFRDRAMAAPVPRAEPVVVAAAMAPPKPEEPAVEFARDERELREGEWRAFDLGRIAPNQMRGGRLGLDRGGNPAWGRIYAHGASQGQAAGARTDFAETVYWHAGLATNSKGEASFAFNVSDSITTFRIRADAFSRDGALGEADGTVEVRRPFYVEPKIPLEVTAGDRIDLPLSLVNGTTRTLGATVETSVGEGIAIREGARWSSAIPGESSVRTLVPLVVGSHSGEVELRLRARADGESDELSRKISVVPAGFPIHLDFGGRLEGVVRHEVTIPDGTLPGSLATQAFVYPSPLASLTQALAALLQEPGGCFEQTSSTNYPNVMTLQYLKTHTGVDPALVRRASELVDRGLQRLTAFECPRKGYEWFGSDPGHEALTAYGIMEFIDMSRVTAVDAGMIARTRSWLLSRRSGNGGFLRDPKALDTFGGAPQNITDAYILWALTESGEKGLSRELDALKETVRKSEDPYLLALAANVFFNAGDRTLALELLSRLAPKQAESGAVPGALTSITRSGGEGLEIETTSLAILGWLRSPEHTAPVEKAMRWLLERSKSGRFGSTQSTILALKAIVAYDAAHARPKQAGTVTLSVDGRAAKELAFPATQEGPIELGSVAAALPPGKHRLELRMSGGTPMPYSLRIQYHARTPATSEGCKVALETSLSKKIVREGEPADLSVQVTNRTGEGLPMVTAIVGLPGGLEARADQLKELVREGKADAVETRGREVIFYWRAMAPKETKSLVLSTLAAVPGQYTGPASRAYLYYTDEEKTWQPGLSVAIPGR